MGGKQKIAFVIGSLTSGGAERVVTTLSRSLSHNYDVTIFTFQKGETVYRLDDSVKVISCMDEIPPSKTVLHSLILNYKLYRRLTSMLKSHQIELVIGFITMANVLTILAAKTLKIPCIVSERNNPYTDATPRFWKLCRRLTYPYAGFLVVQTELIKDFYKDLIDPRKIGVLPNPISQDLTKNRKENQPKENVVLNVGKLHDQKNQAFLIRAFHTLDFKDWKLIIIGEGERRKSLENLIVELKLESNVFLLGRKNNIHDFYNRSKIFAFSSNYEGFPNALIEAMHFGLPCISTDCPTGPSELIHDGDNGFLTPVGDMEQFGNKLQELMDNPELRDKFSKKAMDTTSKFEVQYVTVKWEKVIESVLLPIEKTIT
ncbi:glycosyltransferase family 4 protein [Flagellimonas amoyensis]|uniref:glycosyltransferase family 4 protein n=1 Tax=Flagellimonas amoyensis TaxID=2169401 RepID=UPI000D3A27CF|nr:glycosyltransferase family 4 protein [Allomuricauda amoyensis]